MKTTVESKLTEQKSLIRKAGRIAGITFLFNLIVPTLGYVFIQSQLLVEGNPGLTAENIINNELLFRLGILLEMFLTVGLVALGYSLFLLLQHVNKILSKFAFILKVVEASLTAVVTLFSFFALQILINSNEFPALTENNISIITGFMFEQHSILNSVPMLFLGFEMVLFSLLLYRSELIPKLISGFGIFSFSLIFVYGILSIVNPAVNQMSLTLPSFLFELICGSWLLFKGISMNR